MTPSTTRMVTLRARPGRGEDPTADLFALEEVPIPELQPGELLVCNIAMSVDPSMRGRLDLGEKHYTTNFEIGQPLDGSAIGQVIASKDDRVPVDVVVREGVPRRAILDVVAQHDTDLLAMGTHGRTGLAHLRLGSVSEGVLRAATCDVLIARGRRPG